MTVMSVLAVGFGVATAAFLVCEQPPPPSLDSRNVSYTEAHPAKKTKKKGNRKTNLGLYIRVAPGW